MTVSTPTETLSGQLFGRYQLLEQIGEGGMATVYKAQQTDLDRQVAVKILPPQYANDIRFVRRFRQEANALAQLQHPHIVPLYDFGSHQKYLYLVMPYLTGGDLDDLMGQKPLDWTSLQRIFGDIAKALDYAHQRGIIHRDVKPGNILMDRQGHALLSDFGLAKLVTSQRSLTHSNMVLGSADYMSPEQGLGKPVDHRCDIYSLGVVLFECLTGQTPYEADSWSATIMRAISEPLPLPSQLNPALNPAVDAVITRACAKEPSDRYSTASKMMADLQSAIGDGSSPLPEMESDSSITAWRQAAHDKEPLVVKASRVSNYATVPSRQSTNMELLPVAARAATSQAAQLLRAKRQRLYGWLTAGLLLFVAVASLLLASSGIFGDAGSADSTGTTITDETLSPAPTIPGAAASSRPGPAPQEAIDACVLLENGDACSFTAPNGQQLSGSCGPTQGDIKACKPGFPPAESP